MYKKILISTLVVALVNLFCSCRQAEKVSAQEVFMSDEKITEVVLTDGSIIQFNEKGGQHILINSALVGTTLDNKSINFAVHDIRELRKTKPKSVPVSELGDSKINEVININKRLYIFNENGGQYDKEKNKIIGITVDGKNLNLKPESIIEIHIEQPQLISIEEFTSEENAIVSQIVMKNSNRVTIDESKILYVKVERVNAAGTVLATLGVIVGILVLAGAIAVATKQSCPFVYSHNSEIYIFDAEPLGGAVTKGLQRTELSKLEYIKEVNGKYKLLVRNEVPETQYLDEMSLCIIDHDKGTEIISDLKNKLHTITNPQKPTTARDENNNDLTTFIVENDYTFWQTKLPVTNVKSGDKLRHQLTFSFPKPKDKSKAKLIINAGTSLWGSQMIRELLTLYGEEVETWYERVDNMDGTDMEKEQMMQFVIREELYYLKILVKERDNWSTQGLIFGGGPLIAETRVYDLDLRNVPGDSLIIQINPPFGFWTIDYIAVEYGNKPEPSFQELKLAKAIDHYNISIIEALNSTDDLYYSMPEVGDYFLAEFDALAPKDDKDRTYFLKSTGYYELHLTKDQPIQAQRLYDIINIRGKVVEYAMNLFNEWTFTSK
jgi:hypothetical protein